MLLKFDYPAAGASLETASALVLAAAADWGAAPAEAAVAALVSPPLTKKIKSN